MDESHRNRGDHNMLLLVRTRSDTGRTQCNSHRRRIHDMESRPHHMADLYHSWISSDIGRICCRNDLLISNILSGLKKNVLFTAGNAKLIFLSGFIYMFLVNFRENFGFAVKGASEMVFPFPDMAVPALVITIFGYLYTMAIDIKEENDLTI